MSLLVLALIVFITFNVTIAVQQRIKLQNYADSKAFSMAVAEARTLNYLAYTNRAIASAYVGMANVHAYMSEAAMLADLKLSSATIMGAIAGQEYNLCMCCCTPFGCAPCCFNHCIDAFEAGMNAVGLTIDWISGDMGGRAVPAGQPGHQRHQRAQQPHRPDAAVADGSRTAMVALLGTGTFGNLKQDNMQKADSVTQDEMTVVAQNLQQWNRVFNSNTNQKKQIMDGGGERLPPGLRVEPLRAHGRAHHPHALPAAEPAREVLHHLDGAQRHVDHHPDAGCGLPVRWPHGRRRQRLQHGLHG